MTTSKEQSSNEKHASLTIRNVKYVLWSVTGHIYSLAKMPVNAVRLLNRGASILPAPMTLKASKVGLHVLTGSKCL